MGSWRRQNDDFYHRDVQGQKSMSRKPPPPPSGGWHCSVPSWEKKFCSSVGCISWKKLMEAKKFIYLYDNVIQWDNSAGEEAFNNAKKRFWAAMNHLRCDIPMPDPELYIEDVDWDTRVDPELILELDREKEVREENAPMHDNSRLLDLPVPCTGWGDEEDYKPKGVDKNRNPWERNGDWGNENMQDSGWGGDWNGGHVQGNDGWGGDWNGGHVQGNDGWGGDWNDGHVQGNDGWGGDWNGGHVQGNDGWGGDWNGGHVQCNDGWGGDWSGERVQGNGWRGDDWNKSFGWNQPETNRHERKTNYGMSNDFNGSGGYHGSWDRKDKGESPSCSMSRFKTTRFYGDNHNVNRGGWSGRGKKRGNYSHQRSIQDKNAGSRRWNCA